MIRSYPFWLATAIGVAIGIYIFFMYIQKKEGFVVSTVSGDVAGILPPQTPTECPAGNFVENTSTMPYETQLKTYISSFSDSIKDGTRAPYCASTLRWYDLKTPDKYFILKSSTPPSSIIGTGLPLKNVILTGPPSNLLLNDSTGSLGSFTVFFYATLAIPVLDDDDEITILNFYANTPDMIKLILKRSPTENHVRVQLVLGRWQNRYTWDISTPTFISNGNPSLYAITFDIANKSAVFYIGNIAFTANIQMDDNKKVTLSNTQMEINSEGNLDATLISFGVIGNKLTDADIKNLGSYMYKKHAGTEKVMADTIADTTAAAALREANLSASIISINQRLEENRQLINDLQKMGGLKDMQAKEKREEPKKIKRNWSVSLPASKKYVEGFAVQEPTPQSAYTIVYPVSDMVSAVSNSTVLENTSLARQAKKKAEEVIKKKDKEAAEEAVEEDSSTMDALKQKFKMSSKPSANVTVISATPKGIEPPYYDEKLSKKYPMPLDTSQGWVYQN